MTEHGSLHQYPHATEAIQENPTSFLEKECDCLVPAATEKSIHAGNAPNLKTKAIFEGANGPTTYKAEQYLTERGVVICPDMLVNGGGVTCSYFEWLKNIDHVAPGKMTKKYEEKSQSKLLEIMGYDDSGDDVKGADEIDIVYSGLDEIMSSACRENWNLAVKKNLSYRDACLVNAITKIYSSYKENGIMI